MEPAENRWSDDRLDGLATAVAQGFARVDRELDQGFSRVDRELDRLDRNIEGLRGETQAEFRDLRAEMSLRFDSLNRTLVQIGGGMFATMVVGFAAILLGGR